MSTITAAMIEQAETHPVGSRHHEWTGTEQAEYDSLHHRGRTLYDNLRTQYDASHADAYAAALAAHGHSKAWTLYGPGANLPAPLTGTCGTCGAPTEADVDSPDIWWHATGPADHVPTRP